MNLDFIDSLDSLDILNSTDYIDEKKDTVKLNTVKINYVFNKDKNLIMAKSGVLIKFSDFMITDEIILSQKIKRIENYFTLKSSNQYSQTQIKKIYVDRIKRILIVPRFGIFELLNDSKYGLSNYGVISRINAGELPGKLPGELSGELSGEIIPDLKGAPFQWEGKLTNNQLLLSEYIQTNIYTPDRVKCGSAGLILNLEAGQGKSYLAAYMITKINKKCAIVLHTTSLIEQWVKVINETIPNASIGYYYAAKKSLGDINILIVNSAMSDEFLIDNKKYTPTEYYNNMGFMIFDECHIYANSWAAKLFKRAQAPYMLGLSATPDENIFKFDRAVWWEIGPVLTASDITGYQMTECDFKATVHRIMYYGPATHTQHILACNDMVNTAAIINMICDDQYRNLLIIQCINECLKLSLHIFIFADRREYLEQLRLILIAYGTLNMIDSFIKSSIVDTPDEYMRIVGQCGSSAIARAEASASVILATYQFIGTGKSIPKMTGLILATPRRNKLKQYIGRIFRHGSKVEVERHIYDICDMKICLTSQYNTRKKIYTDKNFNIVQTKHKYEDYKAIIDRDPNIKTILQIKPVSTT